MAAPLRSEIDNEFKWAVNDIYSSDNAWEEDYQKLIKQAGEPCEYQFVLTESADNLYNVLKELNDTDYLVERLYVYAYMRYYEDTANSVYQICQAGHRRQQLNVLRSTHLLSLQY